MLFKVLFLVLIISSASCKDNQSQMRRENWHERSPSSIDLSDIPILGTVYKSFNKIVAKLTGHLVENGDKLAEAVEGPTSAVLGSLNENIAAITNSSKVFRRDLSGQNETESVKDNEYYAEKYAGKYLKKFGKKTEAKRETEPEDLKAKLVELKDRAGKELKAALKEYGTELKKLSGEFVERSGQLGEGFKKQYKDLAGEFVKKVKEAREKKKME